MSKRFEEETEFKAGLHADLNEYLRDLEMSELTTRQSMTILGIIVKERIEEYRWRHKMHLTLKNLWGIIAFMSALILLLFILRDF